MGVHGGAPTDAPTPSAGTPSGGPVAAAWHVSFTVADRDATAELVARLGARFLARTDSDWTRDALVSDPQAAVFTVSQFAPTA